MTETETEMLKRLVYETRQNVRELRKDLDELKGVLDGVKPLDG